MWSRRSPAVGGFPAYLERNLGRIARGSWAVDDGGHSLPFQIVEYRTRRTARDVTWSTLGLSRHPLPQRSGRLIRQELIAVARRGVPVGSWLSVMGQQLLHDHRPFTRGEVTGSVAPVVEGSSLTGFYFTTPSYWDDGLSTFEDRDGPVVMVWAIPVSTAEIAFVGTHGWEAFEALANADQPDLADPLRPEVSGVH